MEQLAGQGERMRQVCALRQHEVGWCQTGGEKITDNMLKAPVYEKEKLLIHVLYCLLFKCHF